MNPDLWEEEKKEQELFLFVLDFFLPSIRLNNLINRLVNLNHWDGNLQRRCN
jgi:hypothetical protein